MNFRYGPETAKADSSRFDDTGSRNWLLAATIIGSSMAFVDGTVVNVALAALQNAFRVSGGPLQWVVEAYVLSLASLLLLGGSFGDLYGRRKMFLLGIIIFACSSVSCGFARSFVMLVASRGIQGIGGALLVPGSLSLISNAFPEEVRGKAIGIWSGTTAIAAMVGPVLGGWLIQHTSWRWIFFLNVPLAVAVVGISLLHVPESRNPHATKPDWIGACLAALGLGSCVFALIEGAHRPIFLVTVGTAGVATLITFLKWESRVEEPMMPLNLFLSLGFSVANGITLLIYAALTGTLYYLPMELIQIRGYTATRAGAALLPISVLIFTLSRFTGGLVKRFGAYVPLASGAALNALGYACLLRIRPDGPYWTTVFPGVALVGLGLAALVAPLTTTVMNSVSEERSGVASGTNNAVSNVASLLAISVFGIVFARAFDEALSSELASSALSVLNQQMLYAQRTQLGGIVDTGGQVGRDIVDRAFIHALRWVLSVSASLSALGSVAAVYLRKGNTASAAATPSEPRPLFID